MIILYIFLIIVLTYIGAWVSASETALFSLPGPKLKSYKSSLDAKKRLVAHLLSRSRDLLVTIFMINTFANILLQNVFSSFYGKDSSYWYKVGIPFIFTLIFGEIIPKYYGLQNNVSFSLKVANAISFLHRWLAPLRIWIVKITTPISRILFFFLKKDEVLSREELEHVIKSSEDKGLLTPDETLLVSGFLDLQDTEVKELMWPKNDILYYDINMPLTKLTHLFLEKEVSRLPVIDNNLDNLLGVIDAYTYFIKMPEIKEPRDLIKYLKKPFFVPETIPAKTLLKRIDAEDQEIAIVVDEYGSVTGLIAREDLLEVVVGQIEDQRDQLLLYTKASKNEIIASGKMELLEFNDLFDVELISENNLMTLGGWLTEQAGDIPQSGSKYSFNGFTFQILSSTPTHVERVYVRKEEDG